MSPEDFRQRMHEHQRPAREMILNPGDPGCARIAKISGVPWWPAGTPRPTCGRGHLMSFMAQFRLSDVPGFPAHDGSLVAFHYCEECVRQGNMSFGWNCPLGNTRGYDVAIITQAAEQAPDGLGAIAEATIEPHAVSFKDALEVPGYEDTLHTLNLPSVPEDYPRGDDDFDENIYPGMVHIAKRKVGGWPTWVQHPCPPKNANGEQRHFLAQLDWQLCEHAAWGSGGYAYLFLIESADKASLRGALAIQTT